MYIVNRNCIGAAEPHSIICYAGPKADEMRRREKKRETGSRADTPPPPIGPAQTEICNSLFFLFQPLPAHRAVPSCPLIGILEESIALLGHTHEALPLPYVLLFCFNSFLFMHTMSILYVCTRASSPSRFH